MPEQFVDFLQSIGIWGVTTLFLQLCALLGVIFIGGFLVLNLARWFRPKHFTSYVNREPRELEKWELSSKLLGLSATTSIAKTENKQIENLHKRITKLESNHEELVAVVSDVVRQMPDVEEVDG